jgi:hypothetical protein
VPSGTNRRLLSPEFDSAAKAQAWQRSQEQEEEAAAPTKLPRIGRNLGRVIDAYVQEAGRADRDPDSGRASTDEQIRELREALSYVDSGLRSIDVSEVRQDDVQRLVDRLWEAGLSAGRIRSVTQALATVYSYAIPRGLVDHSPVVNLTLPRADLGDVAETQRIAVNNGFHFGETNVLGAPIWSSDPPAPATAGFEPPPSYLTPPGLGEGQNATPPPVYETPPPGYTPAPGYPPNPGPAPGFPTPQPGYTPLPGPVPTPPPNYTTPPPEYRPFAPEYTTPPPGYVTPNVNNGFTGGYFTPPLTPQGYPPTTFNGYAAPPNGDTTGAFGPYLGMSAASAEYDATMQERFLWWTVRIIVIVFVLIALVLVAESV